MNGDAAFFRDGNLDGNVSAQQGASATDGDPSIALSKKTFKVGSTE